MLSKVLGIVTAGVFVGAAVVEISGYLTRDRAGKGHDREPPPVRVDPGVDVTKEHDVTAPRHGGAES